MSDEYAGDSIYIEDVRMVFILDFYEEGAPFPYSPMIAAKIRAWIRAKFEGGGAVSFLSDGPLDKALAWWPQSLLGFINDHTMIQHIP